MTTPEVFVVRDSDLLLEAVGARLVTHLVDRVSASGSASLLIASDQLIADLMAVVASGPARDAVDWAAVSVWWANDRWAPASTRHAAKLSQLLNQLGIPATATHPVPEPSGGSQKRSVAPEELADSYGAQLAAARHPDDHGSVPAFDVALLAVGEAGSVAGLHPERPTAYNTGAVAVDRVSHQITLTAAALSMAREVWLLAAGAAAAPGVHLALTGAGHYQVPAAGVRGVFRTLVLADAAAASQLPHELRRIASP